METLLALRPLALGGVRSGVGRLALLLCSLLLRRLLTSVLMLAPANEKEKLVSFRLRR